MKSVLILAYDFPPYVSVGGLRPHSWLKYLKEFDVEPVVVTRQWGNKYGNGLDYIAPSESKKVLKEEHEYGTVIRTPYFPSWSNRILLKHGEGKFRLFRKMLTAVDEIRQFIWISGPKKQLYLAAKSYLRENKVDTIIATGEPFVLFSFASKLSKEFDIPWIADYRDLWSQSKSRQHNKLYALWNRYLEHKIVASACYITTATYFLKQLLEKEIKDKIIYVQANGYNPDNKKTIALEKQNNEILQFVFIGTIYPWHPLKNVLKQFNHLASLESKFLFEINFYGVNRGREIESFIQKDFPFLKMKVKIHNKLNNNELLKILARQNVMILFNDYCLNGTKIYDYLAVERKILFCFNEEKGEVFSNFIYKDEDNSNINFKVQEEIINSTNSGLIVKNQDHLLEILLSLKEEFIENGKIACKSINIEQFSRVKQVETLAQIIKETCE